MNEIHLKALAKINLGLDVLGTRADGYHEVKMIMQSIGLYDKVNLKKTDEPGITMTANVSYIPVNDSNLMVKAAKLMFDTYALPGGLAMDLFKCIPVAAGMAGGSTDAAAVIFGINKMYDLHLQLHTLMELGVKIGADVPFCLMRGTVLAEGIGEKLTRLKRCPKMHLVIAKPPISVSTKMVYEKFDALTEVAHPNTDGILEGIENQDIRKICASMGNVLEDVTVPIHPIIDKIKKSLEEKGAIRAMMSGSGPTVFAVFEDEETASQAAAALKNERIAAFVRTSETF